MVNTNIQGPIPITGSGFVAKPNRGYGPGEFRRLVNAELLDDKIVRRRNLQSVGQHPNTPNGYCEAVGTLNEFVIYAGPGGKQIAVSPNKTVVMFNFSQLFGSPVVVSRTISLVSFFKYNNKNYWLFLVSDPSANGSIYFSLGWCDESSTDQPEDYTLNRIHETFNHSLSVPPVDTTFMVNPLVEPQAYLTFEFNNSFIFKDRLWICTNSTIYFTKATDPTVVALPDGGFFKFPDVNIKWAVALKDTIYIICDTAIYTLNYDTDPNMDATIRKISDNIGGEHAVIFRDTPYFVNKEGIFSIVNNSYVQKVFNSDLDEGTNNFDIQRLTAFEEYLILNKTYRYTPSFNTYFRYNRFPSGDFFPGFTDVTDFIADANTTLALQAVNGLPAATDNAGCMKVSCAIANAIISFKTKANIGTVKSIPVTGGKNYCISGWFQSNTAINYLASFKIYYYDSADALIGSEILANPIATPFDDPQIVFTNAYSSGYGTFKVPDNCTYVQAEMIFQLQSGALWTVGNYVLVDELIVEEGIVPNVNPLNSQAPQDKWGISDVLGTRRYLANNNIAERVNQNSYFEAGLNGNNLGYNTYFINMDTGAAHVLTTPLSNGTDDRVVDLFVNNYDQAGGSKLYLLTKDKVSKNNRFLFMDAERRTFIYDAEMVGATLNRYRPPITIEIDSFTPDGNEYAMKKFRSLEVQGIFPKDEFKLRTAFDNQAFGNAVDINDVVTGVGEARPHYPRRIGINSRGRSMSLKFTTETVLIGTVGDWSEFEISDIRVLWSYTSRQPSYKAFSNSP